MTITLDGAAMTDRVQVHTELARRLELPEYYGRNLDALYDVLTERSEETELVFENSALVRKTLGKYGESLLATIREAAEENPNLTFTLK